MRCVFVPGPVHFDRVTVPVDDGVFDGLVVVEERDLVAVGKRIETFAVNVDRAMMGPRLAGFVLGASMGWTAGVRAVLWGRGKVGFIVMGQVRPRNTCSRSVELVIKAKCRAKKKDKVHGEMQEEQEEEEAEEEDNDAVVVDGLVLKKITGAVKVSWHRMKQQRSVGDGIHPWTSEMS